MDYNKPRIVTFADLQRSLSRFLHTKSAKADLYDLWKLGAPIPQANPRAPEKRILFPGHFARWWQIHVVDKLGISAHYRLYGNTYMPVEDVTFSDGVTFGNE